MRTLYKMASELQDPLVRAASKGDVNFLKTASKDHSSDLHSYFVGRKPRKGVIGNFIHEAVKKNHYTFLHEALTILPPEVVLPLLCEIDKSEGSNPLHYAAKEGNIFTVKLLVNAYIKAYTTAVDLRKESKPPWLKKNNNGNTPLHSCFKKKPKKSHEFVIRYLVSVDHHLLRSLGEEKYYALLDESSEEKDAKDESSDKKGAKDESNDEKDATDESSDKKGAKDRSSDKKGAKDRSSTMSLDQKGASIFFLAMREGFSSLAEQILTSGLPYSLSGTYGENPLHHASKSNEKVSTLLLKRHPKLIGKEPFFGGTMLSKAVEDKAEWLVELMLIEEAGSIPYSPRPWNKACRRLIWHINSNSFGDTPLHIAARKGYIGIAKLLVQGYESAIQHEAEEWDVAEAQPSNDNLGVTPLHIQNFQKDTPLSLALKMKHDDLGAYLLSVERIFYMSSLKDGEGKDANEIAIENGCERSRNMIREKRVRHDEEELRNWEPKLKSIHPSVLKIVAVIASSSTPISERFKSEDIGNFVGKGLPMFEKEPLKDAKLHLKEAAENGEDWLVRFLLEGDGSLINDSVPSWQVACEKGHLSTLLAFIEQCDHKEFVKLCHNNKQTPLHHINKLEYDEYRKLLANPVMLELKNEPDSGGATPLHRAIERNDVALSKSLLETKGIKLNIQDTSHNTAFDLLEEKYITNDHFCQVYKELLGNPLLMPELKNMIDKNGATPLHRAIERNDSEVTKALLDNKGIKLDKTALDLLEEQCEKNSKFLDLYRNLLSNPVMTLELKNKVDDNGATSLHRAILRNDQRLAKALIEAKGVKLEIKDNNGKTAWDLIEERCSMKPTDGCWYELYKNELLNSDRLPRMKNRKGSCGATPLHIAIEWDDTVLAKALVRSRGIKVSIKDANGKMAVDLIEEKCNKDDSLWYNVYEELFLNSLMTYEMKNRVDANGDTPLHRAITRGAKKLVKIMGIKGVEYEIEDNSGKTAVDMIEERCKVRSGDAFWFEQYKELLLNQDMLQKLKNHKGVSGVTPLHIAIEWVQRDDLKLVKTLIRTKGISLHINDDINERTALDLIEERCNQHNNPWYELYTELLHNPVYIHDLKNRRIGIGKETPLHRAIRWGDIKLAKTLLKTEGVELNIKDENQETALDLLKGLCRTETQWGEMCDEIRVDPSVKIFKFKYLQRRTSLRDMHNTLSVVAALLATITFAAGFTVPGGLDSNDGTATLGKKAAFLVFTVTNTLAMCSSMLVLFTVIGATIWEAHPKATTLIDFCVSLLQLSLCGTIVAFMTGVYAIMAPKVKWAAIVVILFCSFTFVFALVAISYFWPILYKPYKLLKRGLRELADHAGCGNFFRNQANANGEQLETLKTQQMGPGAEPGFESA